MIIKNSIKQSKIFELLAKTRGATAEQVTRALNNEINDSKLTQTYALLNKLIDKEFVEYFVIQDSDKQKRLYYLSKKGLSFFQKSIPEGKKGSGLFGDYGFFNHTLYKPKKIQIKHFLMIVDVMIEIYLLKKETNLAIDFAHNLYCATKNLKPDFIFQIGKDKYFIEIDRMNERGIALNKKFEKYNDYFMQTKAEQIKGIYFIVPSPKTKEVDYFNAKQQLRYESVRNAYLETCEKFKETVDLVFLNKSEISLYLDRKFKNSKRIPPKMANHLNKQVPLKAGVIGEDIYVLYQDNKIHSLNVMLEFRETKIWYDLLRLQEKFGEKIESEGILVFNDYKYLPDVNILTTKKNLKTFIADREYPLLIGLDAEQTRKVPQIKITEETK